MTATLRAWPRRRWVVALSAAVGFALVVALPTDLVDTPLFSREIPPTWWSWPVLLVSAALTGLLVGTYVREPGEPRDAPAGAGYAGGLLVFFAVGCPVCNKLVLLALGTSGALAWFEPAQPLLSLVALVTLGWALRVRLRGQAACAVVR